MALGDSITAGFLARCGVDLQPKPDSNGDIIDQDLSQRPIFSIPIAREYRGLSYPIGGDEGAITFPNILSHWNPQLVGMSKGHHPVLACVGGRCLWRNEDGLNAAISGSRSADLILQVKGKPSGSARALVNTTDTKTIYYLDSRSSTYKAIDGLL